MGSEKEVIDEVQGGRDQIGIIFMMKDYIQKIERKKVMIDVKVDNKMREEQEIEEENVGMI